MPKSTAEIPFLSCSSGSILSEDETTARKLEPLITLEESTNADMLLNICFLKSDIDFVWSKSLNIHSFLVLLFSYPFGHEPRQEWFRVNWYVLFGQFNTQSPFKVIKVLSLHTSLQLWTYHIWLFCLLYHLLNLFYKKGKSY